MGEIVKIKTLEKLAAAYVIIDKISQKELVYLTNIKDL